MNPPRIEHVKPFDVVGMCITTCGQDEDQDTPDIWRRFGPIRGQFYPDTGPIYALTTYSEGMFERAYDPRLTYCKWAAVAGSTIHHHDLRLLHVPGGMYLAYDFVGTAAAAGPFIADIYHRDLPNSGYRVDERPHFARMQVGYDPTDPAARETFYIPVL